LGKLGARAGGSKAIIKETVRKQLNEESARRLREAPKKER
jgi:hypothetical protein